jgi:uncharacterized iron-regulated membrane protein
LSETLLLLWITLHSHLEFDERGQTTTEYALVMMAAAAVAGLVLAWATKSHTITRLFDSVIDKVIP